MLHARPFLTLLRALPLGDTAKRKRAASANFMTSLWSSFPKPSSNAVFLLPFTWCFSSSHPTCRTSHGHMSMADVTSTERRVSNSSRKHPIWPSTASCARPTAALLWLLNLGAVSTLSLNAVSACPQRDLVRQCLECWSRIHLQDCFRVRHPFDERSAFSSDFVDSAALVGFWAATSAITRSVTHA